MAKSTSTPAKPCARSSLKWNRLFVSGTVCSRRHIWDLSHESPSLGKRSTARSTIEHNIHLPIKKPGIIRRFLTREGTEFRNYSGILFSRNNCLIARDQPVSLVIFPRRMTENRNPTQSEIDQLYQELYDLKEQTTK